MRKATNNTTVNKFFPFYVAAEGKWFIKATNTTTGKTTFPFRNKFNTKQEAQEMCDKFNQVA